MVKRQSLPVLIQRRVVVALGCVGHLMRVTSWIQRGIKLINNNEKFKSSKSKENTHKKEVGPYRGFGY